MSKIQIHVSRVGRSKFHFLYVLSAAKAGEENHNFRTQQSSLALLLQGFMPQEVSHSSVSSKGGVYCIGKCNLLFGGWKEGTEVATLWR